METAIAILLVLAGAAGVVYGLVRSGKGGCAGCSGCSRTAWCDPAESKDDASDTDRDKSAE